MITHAASPKTLYCFIKPLPQPLFFVVLRGLETQRFRASHMTAAPFFEADESFSASASYSL